MLAEVLDVFLMIMACRALAPPQSFFYYCPRLASFSDATQGFWLGRVFILMVFRGEA